MLVLFDLDDTLLDDAQATSVAVDAFHEHVETSLNVNEFRRIWTAALNRHFARFVSGETTFIEQRRARLREVVQPNLTDAAADELFVVYLTTYQSAWRLFPDVLPCLDALYLHRLGIVSNGSSTQQRDKLRQLGILDRFADVVISEDCGWAKPDQRIFHRACSLAGVNPREAIHVGDHRLNDVAGAAGAGLRAIWLDRHGPEIANSGITRLTTLTGLPELVG
jgi:putative hydrolase of the HAD superfamily